MSILLFIIGTILGSFYLVIATRLPKNEDVLTSRSRCDNCKNTLKWYNLIPLFSYILQKGRCTNCHEKISSEHFWVEFATGILFLIIGIHFEIGYELYACLIIASLMIIIFISDFKYMIILDSPLIIASIIIIILKLIYFEINKIIYSIISGIAIFFIMLLIERLGKILLKKEALGGGDIKFGFFMGLVLNLKLAIVALFFSTFLALPYALTSLYLKDNHEFPYGPFLIGAVFIVFFYLTKFNNFINILLMIN